MLEIQTTYCKTPLGTAKIVGDKNGIKAVSILDEGTVSVALMNQKTPFCLQDCVVQLEEYFNGKRDHFNLTVNPKGTAFQKKSLEIIIENSIWKNKKLLGTKYHFRRCQSN